MRRYPGRNSLLRLALVHSQAGQSRGMTGPPTPSESLKDTASGLERGSLFAVPGISLGYPLSQEETVLEKPTAEHLALAYRSLAWGTFYALVGFTAAIALAMVSCGYYSLTALLEGVREKTRRDNQRFLLSGEALRNEEACHSCTIDLSQPTVAIQQIKELWELLRDEGLKED
ncbi:unnamed protein product [Phytomonas sp. Hart1]|nr:unnamed protein product [Phytomonas sp. Hart1]|eukprot:CCW70208.1 unnamed protein product [Phytomonas sp. isolate Hart1]